MREHIDTFCLLAFGLAVVLGAVTIVQSNLADNQRGYAAVEKMVAAGAEPANAACAIWNNRTSCDVAARRLVQVTR